MDRIEDRAAGAVLASACGDALGAGYEFGPPMPQVMPVRMKGGGSFDWEPGEWTDDTSMAIPILRVLARGSKLEGAALDEIAGAWIDWAAEAKDVGHQTREVCAAAQNHSAAALGAAARSFADSNPRSAGNGSLMRTTPVALAHLDDPAALARAAREIGSLTHADLLAGDACVLWSLAIRSAIVTGDPLLHDGLAALPAERREYWAALIEEAEHGKPADFPKNGWAGAALQAAWAAIVTGNGVVDVLERAVRGGNDTDTVAAIAGGVAGAMAGASALPDDWRRLVHGWPGLTADDLVELAVSAVRARARAAAARPEQVLLQAVRVLHDRGFQAVTIHPVLAAAGFWRCRLLPPGVASTPYLVYLTAAQWDFLGDGRTEPIAPDELADRLIAGVPELAKAQSPRPGYRFWYAALLEHCGGDRLPFFSDDTLSTDRASPEEDGHVGLTGGRGEGLLRDAFPLPPSAAATRPRKRSGA